MSIHFPGLVQAQRIYFGFHSMNGLIKNCTNPFQTPPTTPGIKFYQNVSNWLDPSTIIMKRKIKQ